MKTFLLSITLLAACTPPQTEVEESPPAAVVITIEFEPTPCERVAAAVNASIDRCPASSPLVDEEQLDCAQVTGVTSSEKLESCIEWLNWWGTEVCEDGPVAPLACAGLFTYEVRSCGSPMTK